MIEFIIVIFVAAVAFIWGWKAREYQAMRFLSNYQKMIEEAARAETVNTIMIDVQRDGDQFFIYNKETGEFLAQGTNHADVSAILGERFPSKRFTATPENLKDVGYKHDSI